MIVMIGSKLRTRRLRRSRTVDFIVLNDEKDKAEYKKHDQHTFQVVRYYKAYLLDLILILEIPLSSISVYIPPVHYILQ